MLRLALWMALLAALVAVVWSFAPRRLPVEARAELLLPPATPPASLRIGVVQTGAMQSNALFAYRGGGFEPRQFGMDVVVVEHPRGTVLIDAGFGRHLAAHWRTVPALMRATSKIAAQAPLVEQLDAAGLPAERIKAVILTHAHWDHVSGLDDLRGVPVLVNAEERAFIADGGAATALIRGFGALNYQTYAFDGGPYAGFPRSHDVFGDGALVLVPAGGHTPGSVVAFVRTVARDYALIGDIAWQREGVDWPAERPWAARAPVDEDPAQLRRLLVHLHRLQADNRRLLIVPAHDRRVMASLPPLVPR